MTWERFLALRRFAQKIVERDPEAQVYLVGSVLSKLRPRDVDISIVLPLKVYKQRYGHIPEPGTSEMTVHLNVVRSSHLDEWVEAQRAVSHVTRCDLRYCPDTWWPEKDRLRLA